MDESGCFVRYSVEQFDADFGPGLPETRLWSPGDFEIEVEERQPPPRQGHLRAGIQGKVQVWFGIVLATVMTMGALWMLNLASREKTASTQELLIKERQEKLLARCNELEAQKGEFAAKCELREAEFVARETRIQNLRERQARRVERAKVEGDYIGAAVVLANFAEDIEGKQLSDVELLLLFKNTIIPLLDSAKLSASNSQSKE